MLSATTLFAQSENGASPGINSPYSRYGFGQLSDQSFGNSKAMGGVAIGLRDGRQINVTNPASYTAVDSLTFLFEGGVSLQNSNFDNGTIKLNAKNSTLDYIAMQFRLNHKLAFTAGILPFSRVGYNTTTAESKLAGSETVSYVNTFQGNGGISQAFFGVGYRVTKNLSVGANLSYLFGDLAHYSQLSFSDSSIDSPSYSNGITIHDYKLDLGLQYTHKLSERDQLTLGLTYSLGHELSSTSFETKELIDASTSAYSTTTIESNGGFELPHAFGIGVSYMHNKQLTLAADYTYQKWGNTVFLQQEKQLCNRSKLSIGAEYIPNALSKSYLSRIKYRAGIYYTDSYIKVMGERGASEYGVSAGFGLPLFGSKSLLSISGQYVQVKPKNFSSIKEQQLRINIGITFNEGWFSKWKIQ